MESNEIRFMQDQIGYNFKNVDLKQCVAGQNHIVIFDLMRY